jgi:hypothetical protein
MKKIYFAAILAVFLPMLASAATVNPNGGASNNSVPLVQPLFNAEVAPSTPISAPGFVWGFYGMTSSTVDILSTSSFSYVITFNCTSGCGWSPVHDMRVTSFNPMTGAFTANGAQKNYPAITWTAVGTTTINSDATGAITMQINYTGADAPYTVYMSGTIGTDGTLSGIASSTDGNTYTWTMGQKAEATSIHGNAEACSEFTSWNNIPVVGTSTLVDQSAPDAGINGTVWANDAFNWDLVVRKMSPGNYCGIVHFNGMYVTPTGTEAGPNINDPTSTIKGSTSGSMDGVEVISFSANGTSTTWTSGDIWNWMSDNFVDPQITSQNQLWVYGHDGKTQQWIETYSPTDGWLNYGNIVYPL